MIYLSILVTDHSADQLTGSGVYTKIPGAEKALGSK